MAGRSPGAFAIVLAGAGGERLAVVAVRAVAPEPPQAGDSRASAKATAVARADLTVPILSARGGRAGRQPRWAPVDVYTNLASALPAPGIGCLQGKRAGLVKGIDGDAHDRLDGATDGSCGHHDKEVPCWVNGRRRTPG